MSFNRPVKPEWKKVLLWTLLLAVMILFLDVGCIFRKVTGIPCPGCGMTRAHLAALGFHFQRAFHYHPLWFLPIPLAAVQLFFPAGLFRERKWNNAAAVLLLSLVLAVYAVRMILYFPDTPPMEYQADSLLGWLLTLLGMDLPV
ncbi:MAG TPA: DUF2752 domain-containing protein [Candidatus Merdivicinus excrementipullorum]|uniref:DUF2752 domain-containing protein n=1 Tax=Candidatus Merdivicinus excrementipullorum TaxID=2840867 RepID=A0A9D1FKK9_9FIRM|nr:DUF2752 domain-containing protein [Candidatus Merdivicinus excrementipullorum]